MTIEKMKEKTLSLLGTAEVEAGLLLAALDFVAKKVAVQAKSIKKRGKLTFLQRSDVAEAALPADFAAFGYLLGGRCAYARSAFEIISGKIITRKLGAGTYELIYFAYPPNISEACPEETELGFDAYTADTVAYGAAMELCISACPDDLQRYTRLATEYDGRMANLLTSARDAAGVANTFFAGRHF
ncbi:MAG: hypothetical protein IJW76_08800 [Clostridia bacterium]|nr:hypothetical protein [Clostridia bacterium]